MLNDVSHPIQIFFYDWIYHITDKINVLHEIKMQEVVKSKLLFYSLDLPSGDTSENQSAGTENTWGFEVSKNQAPIMLAAGKMPGCMCVRLVSLNLKDTDHHKGILDWALTFILVFSGR